MCGITVINCRCDGPTSIQAPDRFMKLAVIAIERRGPDATGFAWSNPDGSSYYWKSEGRASETVGGAQLDRSMSNAIGHTRWATQGDVKDMANNHPVLDDQVMLVHNGIIQNDVELFKQWFGRDYEPLSEVDTQVAASLLANRDYFELSVVEVLEQIRGDAAFAWIETDDPDALHLARLDGRPMTLGWTRHQDLVMSSTPETLQDLATFAGVRIRKQLEVATGTYMVVRNGEFETIKSFKPAEKIWGAYNWGVGAKNKDKAKDKAKAKAKDKAKTGFVQPNLGATYDAKRTAGALATLEDQRFAEIYNNDSEQMFSEPSYDDFIGAWWDCSDAIDHLITEGAVRQLTVDEQQMLDDLLEFTPNGRPTGLPDQDVEQDVEDAVNLLQGALDRSK